MILPRINLSYQSYISKALRPIFLVGAAMWGFAFYIDIESNIQSLILSSLLSIVLTLAIIYAIGMQKDEKDFIKAFLTRKLR